MTFWNEVRLWLPDDDERRRRLRVLEPELVW
jgi:predicted metal-dependent hydrolase